MKPPLRLILASSSPQRRRLLAEAGFRFEVVPPHESAECGICSTGGPASLVVELAVNKAADVVAQLKHRGDVGAGALILACDTVAECGGEVLGKPHDENHARGMLQRLRGTVHRVYSGLCLWRLSGDGGSADSDSEDPDVRLAMSELEMDPITDAELEEYLDSGLWEGKAGAFGYQDRVGWLHLRRGTEENVIGLPIDLVVDMLAAHGVSPQGRGI